MVERPGRAATYGQIVTVPNLVSFARLAGVPIFLVLFLGPHADGWAVAVLIAGGLSDWVDGFLARRLGQVSRVGELVDPLADRLYILATLVAFTIREIVPLWFAAALVARELMLGVCLLLLRRYGFGPPPVHYVGKSATFVLLAAFPALLMAHSLPATTFWTYPVGWALGWWGLVFYWLAGALYVIQVVGALRRPVRVT